MRKADNLVLNTLISRVRRLETTVVKIKRQLPQHENQLDLLAASLAEVHEKLDQVNQKVDQKVDKSLFTNTIARIETKLDLVLDALAIKR